jgi:hypothetical protein
MGASLTDEDLDSLRARHAQFRAAIATQLAPFDFLILPSAPINRLPAGQDYTQARAGILRYTIPFSLAGLPVVTLPASSSALPPAPASNSPPRSLKTPPSSPTLPRSSFEPGLDWAEPPRMLPSPHPPPESPECVAPSSSVSCS